MKLTTGEIEALKKIDQRNMEMKALGWGCVFCGCALFTNALGNWYQTSPASFAGFLFVTGLSFLFVAYFRTSPNDRLLELLKKYVNNDPDAIKQIK